MMLSNNTDRNATNETLQHKPKKHADIILTNEEKDRLVRYFSVLVEMDRTKNFA